MKTLICWLFHRKYWTGWRGTIGGESRTDWRCEKCERKWTEY